MEMGGVSDVDIDRVVSAFLAAHPGAYVDDDLVADDGYPSSLGCSVGDVRAVVAEIMSLAISPARQSPALA